MKTVISLENYEQHRRYIDGIQDEDPASENAVKLHVLYFENMAQPSELVPGSIFENESQRSFGSGVADLLGQAKDLIADMGFGWLIIGWNTQNSRLEFWRAANDTDMKLDLIPLVAVDLFEHAYWMDYGYDRWSYVQAYFASLDWKAVEQRLIEARKASGLYSG